MADVLVDSQRRVLISGYGYAGGLPPQPAESLLLGRLDQMDLRLQKLEEQQQRRPPSHGSPAPAPAPAPAPVRRVPAAQHQHTKSMPAALQHQHGHEHVQVRGDLMDRLNLLESRIRQLSCELGLDGGGTGTGTGTGKAAAVHHLGLGLGLGLGMGSSSSVPRVEDPAAWSDSAPVAVVGLDPAFGGGNVQNKSKGKPAASAAGRSWSAVEILQRGARQLQRSTSSPATKVNKLKETNHKEKRRKAERSKSLSLTSRLLLLVGCKT